MTFFLHELAIPEFVYDGKIVSERSLGKMVKSAKTTQLSMGEVYNLSPIASEEAFVYELFIKNDSMAIVRIRRPFGSQITTGYRMGRNRKIDFIFSPEIHYLGKYEGSQTIFPIIDDSQPDLTIRRTISYAEESFPLRKR